MSYEFECVHAVENEIPDCAYNIVENKRKTFHPAMRIETCNSNRYEHREKERCERSRSPVMNKNKYGPKKLFKKNRMKALDWKQDNQSYMNAESFVSQDNHDAGTEYHGYSGCDHYGGDGKSNYVIHYDYNDYDYDDDIDSWFD
jgi:hypothetical protein